MMRSLLIAFLIALTLGSAFAAPPTAPTVTFPRNTTRDQLIASDYWLGGNNRVRAFYTVPATQDLYVQKYVVTMIAPVGSQSFIEILMRPPGESDAVVFLSGVGRSESDWSNNPIVCPGGTVFSIYISAASPITYQMTQVFGLLEVHDSTLWSLVGGLL